MDFSSISSGFSSLKSSLSSLSSLFGGTSAGPGAKGADGTLKLGDFVFKDLEIPEMITLGGDQQTVVHKLVGGARIIDQLGADTQDIVWRGVLLGNDVMDRAVALSTMRKKGGSYTLSFRELRYKVVIQSCRFEYYAFNRIGFTLVCYELPPADPTQVVGPADPDTAIKGDLASAGSLAASIGNGGISGAISSIQSATAGIASFAKATTATINGVLAPVKNAMNTVHQLSLTLNNTVRSVTTLGGILPNNPIAQNASNMLKHLNTLNQLADVNQLASTLARLHSNLGGLNTGGTQKQITVTGGNLMQIAQQHYGDAMQWTKIASANRLSDPQLTGSHVLIIPK